MRLASERILLIGDVARQAHPALASALPSARITAVAHYFDGIAELSAGDYTAIVANTEPIERRPEPAVQTLRRLAPESRLVLFGHPTLEPLSRKMLEFGADDYLVTPVNPGELQQMFAVGPARQAPPQRAAANDDAEALVQSLSPDRVSLLEGLPLAELLLEAMVQHPHDALAAVAKQIDSRIAPTMRMSLQAPGVAAPASPEGFACVAHPVRVNQVEASTLCLVLPRDEDQAAARHFLARLTHLMSKLGALQDRHVRLQKLAITDELTGLYNGRYFRHFLGQIIEKARQRRFPVTLLLFDIDNFKRYNDLYGHGVGDEILRQTAALMKRSCREHDLVSRLSGDEFGVIFWEKEGPRQPRQPSPVPPPRVPASIRTILERFRKLVAGEDFSGLGPGGKGDLTISGGLAVYPFDAADAHSLIEAADRALMFQAKRSGKNSIHLVGSDDDTFPPPAPPPTAPAPPASP